MAGLLLPMLLDAIGGGHTGYHEMATMTSTSQDSSADSNVWNTQGPSANHGSINFNFHVNNENFTSPMGSNSGQARDSQHLKQLMKQNHFLKNILSQIALSIIPKESRRKRSTEEVPPSKNPRWGRRPIRPGRQDNRTGVVCVRPSPRCYPRGPKHFTTTQRPIFPLPLLSHKHKPSECVLNYFAKALQTFRGSQPRTNNKILGIKNVLGK